MPRITKKLPSARNVAPGAKFVQECPVGLTYDRILMKLTNVTLAQITNIEVVANGKTIQRYATGTRMQDLNEYYGRPLNSGYLTFFFERPELTTLAQQRAPALGTFDVQTLTIQADLDGAVVNPAIACHALLSDPFPMGLITKIKEFTLSSAVAGQIQVNEIVRGPNVLAMHFIKADVDNIVLEADSRRVFEGDKADLVAFQADSGRVPQAGFTHADFCLDGDLASALVTNVQSIKDFRIMPTLGTSGALAVVVEYLDGWAGI